MGAVTISNLDEVFKYHAPKGDFQIEKYHRLRAAAKKAAQAILEKSLVVPVPDIDKETGKVVGSHDETLTGDEAQLAAIERFRIVVLDETGDCRDRSEALGMLDAARGFVQGVAAALVGGDPESPEVQAEATQATIAAVRGAVMWANASIALEGRI